MQKNKEGNITKTKVIRVKLKLPKPSLKEHFLILVLGICYQIAITYIFAPLGFILGFVFYMTWFYYIRQCNKKEQQKEYDEMYKTLKKPLGRHGR